jgi:hypothetical protein
MIQTCGSSCSDPVSIIVHCYVEGGGLQHFVVPLILVRRSSHYNIDQRSVWKDFWSFNEDSGDAKRIAQQRNVGADSHPLYSRIYSGDTILGPSDVDQQALIICPSHDSVLGGLTICPQGPRAQLGSCLFHGGLLHLQKDSLRNLRSQQMHERGSLEVNTM